MKEEFIPHNFIYPEIADTTYHFGSKQLEGTPLRADGDWRKYLPPKEYQNKNGVESSACYKEAQQHTIATLLEEQFDIKDENFSGRFNDQEGATPLGGDPLKAADSFRHDGLIPESLLPFSDDITSWKEFNSFKGGNEVQCVIAGKEWLKKWEPKYDVVFTRYESVESKYEKARKALKYSPLPVSVYAWVKNEKGLYVKPKGKSDTHLVELVYIDDKGHAYVWDTYDPCLKKLDPYFNFDFGMRWSIEKRTTPLTNNNWIIELIIKLMKELKQLGKTLGFVH